MIADPFLLNTLPFLYSFFFFYLKLEAKKENLFAYITTTFSVLMMSIPREVNIKNKDHRSHKICEQLRLV